MAWPWLPGDAGRPPRRPNPAVVTAIAEAAHEELTGRGHALDWMARRWPPRGRCSRCQGTVKVTGLGADWSFGHDDAGLDCGGAR